MRILCVLAVKKIQTVMLKKILIIIPILILLLIAAFVVLHWQSDVVSDLTRTILKNNLGDAAEFEYRSLSGDLFKNVIIRDLDITFKNGTHLHTNYLKVNYSVADVMAGRYFFETIAFDSLRVEIPAALEEEEGGERREERGEKREEKTVESRELRVEGGTEERREKREEQVVEGRELRVEGGTEERGEKREEKTVESRELRVEGGKEERGEKGVVESGTEERREKREERRERREEDEERSIEERLNYLASSIPLKTFIESLPELVIDDLSISHGTLYLGSLESVFDDIVLDMSAYHKDQSVKININKLQGAEKSLGFNLKHLRVQIIGNEKRINLNRLEVQTNNSELYAHAEVTLGDSLWIILGIDESHISVADVNVFSKENIADSGEINLSMVLVGQPNRFSTQLASSGSFNRYRLDSLNFDADYSAGQVNLRRSLIARDTSNITFKGRIQPGRNALDVSFNHLNLSDIDTSLLKTNLSGFLHLETKKLNDVLSDGKGRIHLYHSSVDTMKFDTLKFAVDAKNRHISIRKPSFLRVGEQSRFMVEGSLSQDQQLDLRLSTEENILQTLTSAAGIPTFYGQFDGNFFLTGELSDPNLEVYLWIPHLEKDDFALDSMYMQIDIERLASGRQGTGSFFSPHWHYDSLEITETMANFVFDSNRIEIDTLLFANELNYISTTGFIEANFDTVDIAFNFFRLNYQNTWIENDGQLLFRVTPQEYRIEDARFLGSNDGIVEIRGYWDLIKDDMQFGLYVEDFSFAPFRQFLKDDLQIDGKLDADFIMGNPFDDLELDMELKGQDLLVNNIPLGDVECVFQYAQQTLYIDEFKMSNGPSTLEVDGDITVEWGDSTSTLERNLLDQSLADVKIHWQNLYLQDYAPLFGLPRPLKGGLSGELLLAGSIANPEGKLLLTAQNLSYNKFYSDSLYLSGHLNRDSLIIDHLALDLNDTDFEAKGWQLINFDLSNVDSIFTGLPFQLQVNSVDDNISFLGNILDQVERIEGPYEAAFTLSGTFDKPALTDGYFRLQDGQLVLSRIRNPITDLQIDATIENSMMEIHSISGYAGKDTDFWEDAYGVVKRFFRLFTGETRKEGSLNGEGYISLDDIMRPKINLSIDTYKIYLDYFIENTNFVITTDDLQIQGRDTINVTGEITIDEGEYFVDVSKLRKNIYLTSSTPIVERPITWNLDLTIPGNFIISSSRLDLGNNFNFEIMGNFRSIQEANEPTMDLTGYMEIISGRYSSWGQNFTIAYGSIAFTDPKVINPDINIRAEKMTGEYIVEIVLNGTLDKLNREIQVRGSDGTYLTNLSDQEVLSLVSIGQRQMNLAGAGEQVISTTVETAIGRGAEALTGLDKVEIGTSGSLVDLQSMKLNNGIESASVSLGKYLSSNLYIEYTGMFGHSSVPTPTLTWRPGNQIGLEYRINKNWSVGSNFLHTQRGNNVYRIALAWKTSF